LLAGGCGSFYAISITSSAFKDLPMIKQHRLVNDTLKQEIQGIHGLQVCAAARPQRFLRAERYAVVEDECGLIVDFIICDRHGFPV
jgi:acid stress-induced BolA-like protein IbaG/YrbA